MNNIHFLKKNLKRTTAVFATISFIILFRPLAIALIPLAVIYIWNRRKELPSIKDKWHYPASFLLVILLLIGLRPLMQEKMRMKKESSLKTLRDFFLKEATKNKIKEDSLSKLAPYYSWESENKELFQLEFTSKNNKYKRSIRLDSKLSLPKYLTEKPCHNFISNALYLITQRDSIEDFEFINLINKHESMKDLCKNSGASADLNTLKKTLNKIGSHNEMLVIDKTKRIKILEEELNLLKHRVLPVDDFLTGEILNKNRAMFYIFDQTFIIQLRRDISTPEDLNDCYKTILSIFSLVTPNSEMGDFNPWLNQWHNEYRIIVIVEPVIDDGQLNELTPINWSSNKIQFEDSGYKASRSKMCFAQRNSTGVYLNAL
jgi:hypothetical protein